MGVSGKWFKALVGLKKSEKPQSLDKEENVSLFIYLFLLLCCFSVSSFDFDGFYMLLFFDHSRGRLLASLDIGESIRLSLMLIKFKRSFIIIIIIIIIMMVMPTFVPSQILLNLLLIRFKFRI